MAPHPGYYILAYYTCCMNFRFTDREQELDYIETMYRQQGAQLLVVYGRRRLGKTTLLKRFAENKPTVYYMADRGGIQSQRDALARSMAACLNEPLLASAQFNDWYALFESFERVRPADGKLVLIIDEYQYLCQADKAFSSYLQKWWDEHWKDRNLLLILCGSVTSMMHRETLAQSSPLYGRSNGSILLQPIPYTHIREFCDNETQTALVERYALCGGVPRYLELLEPFTQFDEALKKGILNELSPLYREARNLLLDEVDVPNTCWSILEAVSGGATRISEIASKLRLPANQLTRYLALLRDLSIIGREVPVSEKNPAKSKKGIYKVTDPFLRLWFGCVYPYESLFEFGNIDEGTKRIRPQIERHIQDVYEELCRLYVKKHMIKFGCVRIGRQWGRHYELDVAGVDKTNSLRLAGECKWSVNKVGLSILHELQDTVKEAGVPVSDRVQYMLFSKSRFTDELKELAATRENLQLIESVFDIDTN